MEPLDKIIEIPHQVFRVLLFGDSVDANGFVVLQSTEAPLKQLKVHKMKQTGKPTLRITAGFVCYTLQFRFYTLFIAVHDVYVSTTRLLLQWPFLFRRCSASTVLCHCPIPCRTSMVLALLLLIPIYSLSLQDPAGFSRVAV